MTQKVIRANRHRGGCCEEDTLGLSSPELPHWLADPFIQRGYRRSGSGWCATFRSLCSLHNETINIWTHGIGAVFFLVALVLLLTTTSNNLGAGSTLALPSLAAPYDAAGRDVLASAFRSLHNGVDALERAGQAAFSSAGYWASLPADWLVGSAHCGESWPLLVGGRHTSLVLRGWRRRGEKDVPAGAGRRWCCGSDEAAVCTEVPGGAVLGLVRHLLSGARHRFDAAVAEVQRLGARDMEGAGEVLHHVRVATEAHLSRLGEQVRLLGQGGAEWSAGDALGRFLSGAEALELELEGRLNSALLAASRGLGVDTQCVRLTQEQESKRGSARAVVEQLFAAPSHGRAVIKWPVVVFAASALVCLVCSVTFHLFWVVGEREYKFLARLDYSGIAVLIAGSTCPVIEYGLECHGVLRVSSMVLMYSACAAAVGMGLMDRFQTEQWRAARVLVFVGTGCAGILPIGIVYWVHRDEAVVVQAMLQVVVMGAMYIAGAALYVSRVPERFFPGKLDIVGASHQFFHALVFGAALLHYHTVLLLFRWRAMQPACA